MDEVRELKFRAWTERLGMSDPFTVGEVPIWTRPGKPVMTVHTFPNEEVAVMQFIGIQDVNGKDIYGGDILDEYGYLFEVVFDWEWAKFKLQWRTKAIQYPDWNRGKKMAIVGNIHETPELLK